jgi:uncharacterized protein YydD (DUF2326 family)
MIHRIFSSLATFKELTFAPHLNLLVVDTTDQSTDLQTRNRAGKSSFVEIVHFLTGANADADSIFRAPELIDHAFGVVVEISGRPTTIQRSGSRPSRIEMVSYDASGWPAAPEREIDVDVLPNEQWKSVLGAAWFGLDAENAGPHAPSLRSLFPYFARRDPGGFNSPFKHFPQQSTGDVQVAMSFLLGLDWTISQQLQVIRDQEASLRALRQATRTGAVPGALRPSGEIRSELAVAEQRASRAAASLEEFQVLEEYEDFEIEASRLTGLLNEAADQNTADQMLLRRLDDAVQESPDGRNGAEVARLYERAGLELPESALRRFEEVQNFHASVLANRRAYLQQEIEAADQRIADRRASMVEWDRRRAEIMAILQTHGALSQFAQLQGEVARLQSQASDLRRQFEAAERIEGTRADLEIERTQLTRRLHQDFAEREAILREVILTFEEVSSSLYDDAGTLQITETPNGPAFDVRIQGESSRGVRNMQTFCLDITISRVCAGRGIGPGFLIHDSHLFDGVDERQVGHALATAKSLAESSGFQYIVTMNSDDLPVTLPEGFVLEDHVLPVRLTDARDDGGLFGFRF